MADLFLPWERDGFAAPPERYVARGSEIILRAYSPRPGAASEMIGNCFFVHASGVLSGPIVGFDIEPECWTGAFLEERLNAWVFGNTFERIAIWVLNPGAEYDIGLIGHDTRYYDGELGYIVRHLPWPGGNRTDFRQVVLALPAFPDKRAFKRGVLERVRFAGDFAVRMPLNVTARA